VAVLGAGLDGGVVSVILECESRGGTGPHCVVVHSSSSPPFCLCRNGIQMAKEIASLDHISSGRSILGLGFGWNLEEAADHGVDPAKRGPLLDEKLAAMRQQLWAYEVAESYGETSIST
jgi:Luciferase-like monooxygenase